MSARIDPIVFRNAAERVDEFELFACTAIQASSGCLFALDPHQDIFARLFKPKNRGAMCSWWEGPHGASPEARVYLKNCRVFALLLAELIAKEERS